MRLLFLPLVLMLAHARSYCLSGERPVCSPALETPSSPLFVIDHYVTDSALRRSWAIVIDCMHPQWPPELLEIRSSTGTGPSQAMFPVAVNGASSSIVKQGTRVEVWSGGPTTIRLSGIALESAALGQPIKVRAGLGIRPLCGRVRGENSVQLMGNDSVCRREP